jgi:hypothetical protein
MHLRLAGLAPTFGGDRPFRLGNAGRSGGWQFGWAGGGALVRVGGTRGPRSERSWRRVGSVRGDSAVVARPPLGVFRARQRPAVGAIKQVAAGPPGGRTCGVGWARWLGLAGGRIPLGRVGGAYAARVADGNVGSRPAGRCRWSASAEQGTQADQPNRGDFTRPDALNRSCDLLVTFGWLA